MTVASNGTFPIEADARSTIDELRSQLSLLAADIADGNKRRDDAEVKARALVKLKKVNVAPKDILDLLDSCDVPPSLLSLVSRRLTDEAGKRVELLGARRAAVAFEAKYEVKHGCRPSAQAVSVHVFGTNTQRKKVGEWRRSEIYKRYVNDEVYQIRRDADERLAAKVTAHAKRLPELIRIIDTALQKS